jgi:hypothetical protein
VDRRRARLRRATLRGGNELSFRQCRRRRQDGHRRCVRHADRTQGAVVRGLGRCLLRRLSCVLDVADRNIAEWIGGNGQWRQRDRGKQKELAPDGKQRRGEPDRGLQP